MAAGANWRGLAVTVPGAFTISPGSAKIAALRISLFSGGAGSLSRLVNRTTTHAPRLARRTSGSINSFSFTLAGLAACV